MSISDIEVKQEEKIRSRFNQRVFDLKTAYAIKNVGTTADLVDKLHHRIHERNLLVHDYGLICSELNKVRSVETNRTPAEERFIARFKNVGKSSFTRKHGWAIYALITSRQH